MMRAYARIDNGIVVEIIELEPNEAGEVVPIERKFTAEFVATLIEITDLDPKPSERWTYDGEAFAAPVPYQPTPDEIKAVNTSTRDYLIAQATLAIAPLQDAIDLDEATAEETALLTKWKQYRVAVNRIDVTQVSPKWPVSPTA